MTDQAPPERIWLSTRPYNYEASIVPNHPDDIEYIRTDLAAQQLSEAVEKARREVWVEVFTIAEEILGDVVMQKLREAARQTEQEGEK